MDQQTLQSFQSQLNNVTNVLIVLKPNPNFDMVSSAVSMALSMEKMQKKVTVFCPTPLTVEFGNLVGINKVREQVGNKNLVVTIKGYSKAGVDKVTYNVEGEDFNLIVVPKAGTPPFDPKNIVYNYTGVDAEMIVTIGIQSLDQLGDFYQREKEFFAKTPIANVDADLTNANYATFNLTNQAASSVIEISGYLLQYLKYQVDSDIATNTFYGLMEATNNLSDSKVRAETYELIGIMLRMGARRIQVMQFLGAQILAPEQQIPNMTPVQSVQPNFIPQQQTPVTQPVNQPASTVNPPADWTQPKIYKGGSLG
jgi:nanoRNase/pAp phosphatase (c-di-AMP/oligoRNAs hydrolase)